MAEPPFDKYKATLNDYNRRIDVLSKRVPGTSPSPFYTQQLAKLRDRHAGIMEIVERALGEPADRRTERESIEKDVEELGREIDELERG